MARRAARTQPRRTGDARRRRAGERRGDRPGVRRPRGAVVGLARPRLDRQSRARYDRRRPRTGGVPGDRRAGRGRRRRGRSRQRSSRRQAPDRRRPVRQRLADAAASGCQRTGGRAIDGRRALRRRRRPPRRGDRRGLGIGGRRTTTLRARAPAPIASDLARSPVARAMASRRGPRARGTVAQHSRQGASVMTNPENADVGPVFGAGIWHFATYVDRYATDGYGDPVTVLEAIDLAGKVGELTYVDINYPFFGGADIDVAAVEAALARNKLRVIGITPEIYTRVFAKGADRKSVG